MDTATELAELKKEVATLKEQMAELKRFLDVRRSPEAPDKPYLSIWCSSISLVNPKSPAGTNGTVGELAAKESGPVLRFWGDDSKTRLLLNVKDSAPSLQLFNAGVKPAIVAGLNPEDERAFVAVFDHGVPRVTLKAAEDGGVVSATNDDGLALAVIRAGDDCGEVAVLKPDAGPVGSLTSDSKHGGGSLVLSTAEGRKSVTLTNTKLSGIVAVHDVSGKLVGCIPAIPTPPDEEARN